jgi:hypothetical protein
MFFVSLNCICSGAENPLEDVGVISTALRNAHAELLHLPGGWQIDYQVTVQQDKELGPYSYPNGVQGILRMKWPELYVRVVGDIRYKLGGKPSILEGHVREGNYNFANHTSLVRESDMLAQACDFRHVITAKLAYPLAFRYFAQANQMFVNGQDNASNTWLPDAFEAPGYMVGDESSLFGLPCVVVERPGADKLWICRDKGYVVLRRELYGNDGKINEVTVNRDLRRLSGNIWLPHLQIKKTYGGSVGALDGTLTLKVNNVRSGDLQDKDFRVDIPDDVAQIDDFIQGTSLIQRAGTSGTDAEVSISEANRILEIRANEGAVSVPTLLVAINAAVVLGLVNLYLIRRRTN